MRGHEVPIRHCVSDSIMENEGELQHPRLGLSEDEGDHRGGEEEEQKSGRQQYHPMTYVSDNSPLTTQITCIECVTKFQLVNEVGPCIPEVANGLSWLVARGELVEVQSEMHAPVDYDSVVPHEVSHQPPLKTVPQTGGVGRDEYLPGGHVESGVRLRRQGHVALLEDGEEVETLGLGLGTGLVWRRPPEGVRGLVGRV